MEQIRVLSLREVEIVSGGADDNDEYLPIVEFVAWLLSPIPLREWLEQVKNGQMPG